MNFDTYQLESCFDELLTDQLKPRAGAEPLLERLAGLPHDDLVRRQKAAETALLNMGVTFTVYGHDQGMEKIWPFDIIPRVIAAEEWGRIERGLKQRIVAINQFIDDVYHDQKILQDGAVPPDMILKSRNYRPEIRYVDPPKGVWCHISGIDLVRHKDGEVYILEDNLRCPSGVSYVLENRHLLKRTFPRVFEAMRVRRVDDYCDRLLLTLQAMAPGGVSEPNVVLLSPGIYNSAYFEHAYLAQQMGIELVEGSDLVVRDGFCYMRTTHGFEKVDVIYRRINDEFLDPLAFRPDSALGVPGIMDVWMNGRVALANAPGTGIADDKAVCAYVPEIIRYYLGEDPILNNVPTYICRLEKDRKYVLEHLDELVVKPTNEAGGYGMLIGPHATQAQRDEFAELIRNNPTNYIAQPTLSLSRVPVIVNDHLEGRHVDLRPFILYGDDVYVLPGGLTRVALRKGSLVVNSSQGGGSKDTWVLES